MGSKKPNRTLRILKYYFNCLWYYVLFPLGTEEDDFSKQFKKRKSRQKKFK